MWGISLNIHLLRSNMSIYFWPPGEYVQYLLSFSSVSGLHQLLGEISVSLAAKCCTMFTSLCLTVCLLCAAEQNIVQRAVTVNQNNKVAGRTAKKNLRECDGSSRFIYLCRFIILLHCHLIHCYFNKMDYNSFFVLACQVCK